MSSGSGHVEPGVAEEFPGLRLFWAAVEDAGVGGSLPAVRQRLRELSDRYRGAGVVAMRTQPIPHAYRVFFRQVGLDPDAARIPSEEAAIGRLLKGGFEARDALADALLIALVETGVPVWALDSRVADAETLGIRVAVPGDRLGSSAEAVPVPAGQLIVADSRWVHATLFGGPAQGHGAGPRTEHIVLFAVGVDGVPAIHIEEALWVASDVLGRA